MKDKMKAAKRYAYAKGKGKEQADQTLRVKKELEAQHWVRLHPSPFDLHVMRSSDSVWIWISA